MREWDDSGDRNEASFRNGSDSSGGGTAVCMAGAPATDVAPQQQDTAQPMEQDPPPQTDAAAPAAPPAPTQQQQQQSSGDGWPSLSGRLMFRPLEVRRPSSSTGATQNGVARTAQSDLHLDGS